jgi:hypothetical protein
MLSHLLSCLGPISIQQDFLALISISNQLSSDSQTNSSSSRSSSSSSNSKSFNSLSDKTLITSQAYKQAYKNEEIKHKIND